jgi:hypothetical protein
VSIILLTKLDVVFGWELHVLMLLVEVEQWYHLHLELIVGNFLWKKNE